MVNNLKPWTSSESIYTAEIREHIELEIIMKIPQNLDNGIFAHDKGDLIAKHLSVFNL
jgi:hypothetical protein